MTLSSKRIANERCPECAKKGKDRHGDNLVRYDDGHAFCFSCGHKEHSIKSLEWLRKNITKTKTDAPPFTEMDDIWEDLTYKYPTNVQEWLTKYGITELECIHNQIQWSPARELLVFPILSHISNKVIGTSSRYFGTNIRHPKYISDFYGTKDDILREASRLPKGNTVPTLVLVEDMVSAIKVSRTSKATLALLGTYISKSLFAYLVAWAISQRLVICPWLDPDKKLESIKYSRMFRQYTQSYPIISDKDPKYYNNADITNYLLTAITASS